MEEITVSEFEAKCEEILERVRVTKTPVCVTRFGKPFVEIRPHTAAKDEDKDDVDKDEDE